MDNSPEPQYYRPAKSRSPKTKELSLTSVEFIRDVLPNYLPVFAFLVKHFAFFAVKGNLILVLLIAFLINFPYYGKERKLLRQEWNLDRKTEQIFKADKRFMGPLYAFVAYDALTWIWCLCVISGVYPSWLPASVFEDKIS